MFSVVTYHWRKTWWIFLQSCQLPEPHFASIDIKETISVPGDVEKSINLSYHSLSVTLFWPGVANWTMKMYFSTTLLGRKPDSPQSVDLPSSKIAVSTHMHTYSRTLNKNPVFEGFLTRPLTLSTARTNSYYFSICNL